MYHLYKWLHFFFLEWAKFFESCAEVGMIATLKIEFLQNEEKNNEKPQG